jgi:RNA polymerase sigma factor (sigma-70 family)
VRRSERDAVVLKFLPLIRRVAKRHWILGHEHEDLVNAAIVGVLERLERFSREVTPAVIASMAKYAVLDYGRRVGGGMVKIPRSEITKRKARGESLPFCYSTEAIAECKEAEDASADELFGEEDVRFACVAARDEVERLLEQIPERHEEVLKRYFGTHGRRQEPMAAIARDLRISESRVSQVVKDGLFMLRLLAG